MNLASVRFFLFFVVPRIILNSATYSVFLKSHISHLKSDL